MSDIKELLRQIYGQNALLGRYADDYNVIENPGGGLGQIEYYPPAEAYNPAPGRPTLELYNTSGTGDQTRNLLKGDMLHDLPGVDRQWKGLRDKYLGTLTPRQRRIDLNAFERERSYLAPGTTFEEYMEHNRADAHLRGYLTPDAADEWKGSYTPEQAGILDIMRTYLQRGYTQPGPR